jgi:hypothetical protein
VITRRKLFQTLAAAAAAVNVKEIEVAIADVKPGNTIVLRLPADKLLTNQETMHLRDAAQKVFPNNKVIVLTDGIDLQIVKGA